MLRYSQVMLEPYLRQSNLKINEEVVESAEVCDSYLYLTTLLDNEFILILLLK